MSDTTIPRDGAGPSDPEPAGPDPWPDPCTPSALGPIEASSGPVPRVSLRDDVDDDATTARFDPGGQGESSPPGPGRYAILGEIARGGMGAVLRGHDADLNRELAIKVLLEKYAENVEVLGRFVEEAQIGGQLQHPGIVPVYELGQFADKRPFFAMKLVKGRTLAELLKERTSPTENLPRFLKIFEQICETMAYAHSKGVIHRDLKPLNVMVGAFGEVQVMDWGLAKILDRKDDRAASEQAPQATMVRTGRSESGSNPTEYGDLMGTVAYMPPEQARGETDRLDERADVFALGSILCEVLTGQPAYRGRTIREMIDRAKIADLADARARLDACGCEPELIAIAAACLAPIAEDRPRDASEVTRLTTAHISGVQDRLRASEIARAEADARAEAEEARAESEKRRAESERARRRATLALAAAVLLAITIGGGSWMAFRLDRDARLAESDRMVGDALASAHTLRDEAERTGPEAVESWGRALAAADRAKDLMVARPPRAPIAKDVVTTHDAVTKSAAEAAERVRQVAADRQLVTELDEARLQMAAVKDDSFDWKLRLAAYEVAFRKAGIEFGGQPAEEIAARLRSKRDLQRIVAVLDDWASEEGDKSRRDALTSVARSIDPERNPLRDVLSKGDRAALLTMARDPEARRMPPVTACQLARILKRIGSREDAIALLFAARASSPTDFWINHDLGFYLNGRREPAGSEDAVRFLTVAAALRPDSPGVLLNLGSALRLRGKLGESIAAYREGIRLKPDYADAYCGLGAALFDHGKYDEGVAALREAIRLKPGLAAAHANLGVAFETQGNLDEAFAELGEAIRLKPEFAEAHYFLGGLLLAQGKFDDAVVACREAVRLAPELAEAHCCLGGALKAQGNLDEAVATLREAIRIRPDYAMAYSNLGAALKGQGKLGEAMTAYREAIRIEPSFAESHINLGLALRSQGQLAEALTELRKGHALGSKRLDWPHLSAGLVAECEALIALEGRLPALLRGDDAPKDNAERLELGELCYATKRFAASARFWRDAMAEEPKLADDREAALRYNAASSAVLAGTGQGADDPKPDDAARAKLRSQAKDWLRAELSAWKKVAMTAEPGNRPLVAKTLAHWKADGDLAGVRDADGLAQLPEAERAEWIKLWGEVDALLAKVAKP